MIKFVTNIGLTLLELIICITLVTILSYLTLPLTQTLLVTYRRQLVKEHLLLALTTARNAAINKRRIVTFCPSPDKKHCNEDWQQQWLLFIDPETKAELDDTNKLLHIYLPISYGHLYLNAFPRNSYFRFLPNGFSAQQNGSFYFCYKGKGWKLIINRLGRMRFENLNSCSA